MAIRDFADTRNGNPGAFVCGAKPKAANPTVCRKSYQHKDANFDSK